MPPVTLECYKSARGNGWEGALMELEHVMVRLRHANFELKAKKCFLFQTEAEYLGHEVSGEGVCPLSANTMALTQALPQ